MIDLVFVFIRFHFNMTLLDVRNWFQLVVSERVHVLKGEGQNAVMKSIHNSSSDMFVDR